MSGRAPSRWRAPCRGSRPDTYWACVVGGFQRGERPRLRRRTPQRDHLLVRAASPGWAVDRDAAAAGCLPARVPPSPPPDPFARTRAQNARSGAAVPWSAGSGFESLGSTGNRLAILSSVVGVGQDHGRFLHGVASGDPLVDRVVIWTRVSDTHGTPVDVSWMVARDVELSDVVASGTIATDAERDHTVSVDVAGLESDAVYFYAFGAGGAQSPVGRKRTLPRRSDHIRFAMVSCAKFNAGYFNAYARIADRQDLGFLLHLGDYIYEASNKPPPTQTPGADIGRPFDPLHECVTLDDYRRRYAQYRRDPDVQRLHAAHPVIATIDDHEFADGAWRDGADNHKPEWGPWEERKARAFRAKWEWVPGRPPAPDDPSRVFRTVPLGGLAELFVLDTRTRRDRPVPPPAMYEAQRSALGPEQRKWLFDGLKSSTAIWHLLANPSVMARTWDEDLPDDLRPHLVKVKLLEADGRGPDFDQWDGYPSEREALLRFIRDESISDVVVLSGDVHVSLALEMDVEGDDGEPVTVEFVTPSITSQNLDDKMGWAARTESVAIEDRIESALPHWKWSDLDSHGYVVVDVTPQRLRADWWFSRTVLQRAGEEDHGAAWMVERGRGRLAPALARKPL